MCIYIYTFVTNRQTNKRTNKQTNKQTSKQTNNTLTFNGYRFLLWFRSLKCFWLLLLLQLLRL